MLSSYEVCSDPCLLVSDVIQPSHFCCPVLRLPSIFSQHPEPHKDMYMSIHSKRYSQLPKAETVQMSIHTDEWIHEIWYSYTIEYSAIKAMILIMLQNGRTLIILSERSQLQTATCYVIPFI